MISSVKINQETKNKHTETKMIEVSGSIDELLVEFNDISSVYNKEETLCTMLDCPIIRNGSVVGVISEIDIDEGIWYGVLWDRVALNIDSSIDNTVNSVRIVEERGE